MINCGLKDICKTQHRPVGKSFLAMVVICTIFDLIHLFSFVTGDLRNLSAMIDDLIILELRWHHFVSQGDKKRVVSVTQLCSKILNFKLAVISWCLLLSCVYTALTVNDTARSMEGRFECQIPNFRYGVHLFMIKLNEDFKHMSLQNFCFHNILLWIILSYIDPMHKFALFIIWEDRYTQIHLLFKEKGCGKKLFPSMLYLLKKHF